MKNLIISFIALSVVCLLVGFGMLNSYNAGIVIFTGVVFACLAVSAVLFDKFVPEDESDLRAA